MSNNEISNSVQLYLSSNKLSELPSHLFKISNLSVLSVRNNILKQIPTDIEKLVNLQEFSVSGNQLQYLPCEILKLPKLTLLTTSNNPFMTENFPKSNFRIPDLQELCLRKLDTNRHEIKPGTPIPIPIQKMLKIKSRKCFVCNEVVVKTFIHEVAIQTVLDNTVPIYFYFCSPNCYHKHKTPN